MHHGLSGKEASRMPQRDEARGNMGEGAVAVGAWGCAPGSGSVNGILIIQL